MDFTDDDAAWPFTAERTLHVKGFAGRVDFGDDATRRAADSFLLQASGMKPDCVVWDGDNFGEDSFTRLIPDLAKLLPTLKLVAFLRTEDRERFCASWSRVSLPAALDVRLCPDELDWTALGQHALQRTGARTCFCFGGGSVVKEEVVRADSDVSFVVWAVERRGKDGGVEQTALQDLRSAAPPNLRFVG